MALRPIRPGDEPRWLAFLSGCSPESIYARFRGFFRWMAPGVAERCCHMDYSHEIALAAERLTNGGREFLGIGRLAGDSQHDTVEFAVIIADPWQGKGLGGILLDMCIELARDMGYREIVAETTPYNHRMLRLFTKREFRGSSRVDEGVVRTRKRL